jgi:hypothetical protein
MKNFDSISIFLTFNDNFFSTSLIKLFSPNKASFIFTFDFLKISKVCKNNFDFNLISSAFVQIITSF